MHRDRHGLRSLLLQHQAWTLDPRAVRVVLAIGRQLFRDEGTEVGAGPARARQQGMGVREGAQTAFDRGFELIRRLALRQMHRRLRQRQQVLVR